MSKINALVAPVIDHRLTEALSNIRMGWRSPTFYKNPEDGSGKHFDEGSVVFTDFVGTPNTNILRQVWEHGKFRGDRKLPTKAPVTGTYHLHHRGPYGKQIFSPYDDETAQKINALPQTFDEAVNYKKQYAFIALTTSETCPSGLSIHHEFFDYLEENQGLVSKWLSRANVNEPLINDFWKIFAAEKRRMQNTYSVLF